MRTAPPPPDRSPERNLEPCSAFPSSRGASRIVARSGGAPTHTGASRTLLSYIPLWLLVLSPGGCNTFELKVSESRSLPMQNGLHLVGMLVVALGSVFQIFCCRREAFLRGATTGLGVFVRLTRRPVFGWNRLGGDPNASPHPTRPASNLFQYRNPVERPCFFSFGRQTKLRSLPWAAMADRSSRCSCGSHRDTECCQCTSGIPAARSARPEDRPEGA